MRIVLTTLCYIEQDDSYLMLHRTKKENDLSKDMWIGVGGHFEKGESPDECLRREVEEETGLLITSYQLRGIVTFHYSEDDNTEPDDNGSNELQFNENKSVYTEYMFLYTADQFEGDLKECDEGELRFVKKSELKNLYFWSGDEIFLRLIRENHPVFDLKLTYRGRTLKSAVLDGKELELFDVIDENYEPTGIVRERTIVHETGTWHRTSHVWIYRRKADGFDILLQKRAKNKDSFPECYDISSAGHIPAGKDYMESALRELKEELGIEAKESDLVMIGSYNTVCDSNFYGKIFSNREHSNIYVLDGSGLSDEDFRLQQEEVEEVIWVDYDRTRQKLMDGTIRNCIIMDEWDMLNKIRDRIKL